MTLTDELNAYADYLAGYLHRVSDRERIRFELHRAAERARVKALIEKLRDDWEDDYSRKPSSYEPDFSDKDKAKACDVILDRIEAGAAEET